MYNKIIIAGNLTRDIEGYKGLYAVTEDGRVWSYPKRQGKDMYLSEGKFLKGNTYPSGYKGVTLSKNNEIRRFLVHRLVAGAFISNPKNKRTVNHINGVKGDNNLSNLEWATYSENHKHAFRLGLMKISDKSKAQARINQKKAVDKIRKISIDDASEICEAYATGIFSCRELAECHNVSTKTINNLVRGVSYVA